MNAVTSTRFGGMVDSASMTRSRARTAPTSFASRGPEICRSAHASAEATSRMETAMIDYPILREKLGPDGLEELRRLIADELARQPRLEPPTPPTRPTIPGPDEDIRPRS